MARKVNVITTGPVSTDAMEIGDVWIRKDGTFILEADGWQPSGPLLAELEARIKKLEAQLAAPISQDIPQETPKKRCK